ncbi:MAG: hypothetical protein EP344_08940 [Bacteroidetes bacterium]|nr:MAG: hypothetical protein EP344_08940 [Bacteroidota bacterium]
MKHILFFFSATLLLFSACGDDPANAGGQQNNGNSTNASPMLLSGHWVAIDFCSRANQYGSVLDAMNQAHLPYAYSISFDPANPDSVVCHNGIESWTCLVKYNVDTLEIVNARDDKSVFLLYNSQGEKDITMFDPTQGRVRMDRFIKSGANTRDGYSAFTTALNHNLFGGIFRQIGKGATADTIQFTPGGFIMKWAPFDRYNVCTSGSCFVCGNDIDVLTVSKYRKEGSEQIYGFRFNGTNDTLSFFNLVPPPASSPEGAAYSIGRVAYQFVRMSGQ